DSRTRSAASARTWTNCVRTARRRSHPPPRPVCNTDNASPRPLEAYRLYGSRQKGAEPFLAISGILRTKSSVSDERSAVRPLPARFAWVLVALSVLVCGSNAAAALGPALSQFTPFHSDTTKILEGNWQSCRENDGQYSERVYDHVVNGVGKFE